ncbi:hypothetical protein [Hyphomonas sp.]|uniref:hypothetical protein n=1 Tax=Hyphomonas sp. TaxID=87 RepID=UPI0039192687
MIRRIAGAIVALIAAWMLWDAIYAVQLIVSRGSPLSDALLNPPTSGWRLVAGGLALGGGLLAALRLPFGGVLGLIGGVLFIALAVVMASLSANSNMITPDSIAGLGVVIVSGVILFTRRDWVQ